MNNDLHSCGYFCERPACIKAQRDQLVILVEEQHATIEHYEALLRQALESSQAVIDRWDSPVWKDLPHTGTYILQLRKLVVALEQRLGEKG